MKRILALPKKVFDEYFSNVYFLTNEKSLFISVLDPDNEEKKYDENIENFLQVKMWDIEKDAYENEKLKYEKPSDKELVKIVNFVNRNLDKRHYYIHCSAGISRSGAIAEWLRRKFNGEINKNQFFNENCHILPNLYILKRLLELDLDYEKNQIINR